MTSPTRLILIRHGAVAAPWHDRIYGRLDVPLSLEGEEEARRAARRLEDQPLDAVVSSGLARAEFTAALLRGTRGLVRRDDPRLVEFDRGPWAGRDRDEIAASDPDNWAASRAAGGVLNPPGGERIEDLAQRVLAGLDAAAELAPGRQVAVVAHLWVLRAAVATVLGLDLLRAPLLEVPTSGLALVEWPTAAGRAAGQGKRMVCLGPDWLPARHPPE